MLETLFKIILVTGFVPASLLFIEATVNSVFYGFGEHSNSTDNPSKALSRCVCFVTPHKLLSRRFNGLRCSDNGCTLYVHQMTRTGFEPVTFCL